MPEKPARDAKPKQWQKTQGDAERALHVDDMALRALASMMADEKIPEGYQTPWWVDMMRPNRLPENAATIEQMQGARFGPTQGLFDLLRSNPTFQRTSKQDTTPNEFLTQGKQ